MDLRTRYLARILGMALILLPLLVAMLGCEGESITIERTEDGAVVRSDGDTLSTSAGSSGPAGPTATPRPRIEFPPESDGAALTALFDATDGEGWHNSDSWLYMENLGQWAGVTTNAAGRVTGLDLSDNGLSGDLPEDIEYLTELTELNLSNNDLSGPLPAALVSLANLEELYINGNQFSGALPVGLESLADLTDLHLHDNRLGGEFPVALAGLPDLESVTIWGNPFTWAESYPPGILADMVGLMVVHESLGGENWGTSYQWLTGTSAANWGGVTTGAGGRVTELAFADGILDGEIPSHLGNMTGLTRLIMAGNPELKGEIPPTFSDLVNLQELDLSRNRIDGEIPSGLTNAAGLQTLSLHDNRLSGEIPPELGTLADLEILSLNNNELSGPIPAELGNLSGLEELRLSGNRLDGPVPAELGSLANLTTLLLDGNSLSGELPTELGNLSQLEGISLWGNDFSGADSYANARLGDLVALMALYEVTSPQTNWNELSGFPSDEWHHMIVSPEGRVRLLNLENTNLTGNIPTEIGLLTGLEQLLLGYNPRLSGNIPLEIGNLINLEELNLIGNGHTGEIPPELGNLAKLTTLDLSFNRFSGSVPTELASLVNLQELYLRDNDLSGEFPDELSNLQNLRGISLWGNDFTWVDSYANVRLADLVALMALYEVTSPQTNWNELSGFPSDEWHHMIVSPEGRVRLLNLENTNLTGNIPTEIGLLTGLEQLLLGYNPGLAGNIPPEMGNLINLEELNLIGNGHTGEIPPELGNLAKLTTLDLSFNKFSGSVPTELASLVKLQELYLRDNDLGGEFPSELGNLPNLRWFSLWGNDFTWADSYANASLGDMIALMAIYEATSPETNWEELLGLPPPDNLPGMYMSVSPAGRVEILILESMNLTGIIPPEFGFLTALETLRIKWNPGLGGCIPASMRGINYQGDLPFCTGATSKKALTPAGQGLLG